MTRNELIRILEETYPHDDDILGAIAQIDKLYGELEMWKVWAEKVTKTEGLNPVLYRSLIETMIKR